MAKEKPKQVGQKPLAFGDELVNVSSTSLECSTFRKDPKGVMFRTGTGTVSPGGSVVIGETVSFNEAIKLVQRGWLGRKGS